MMTPRRSSKDSTTAESGSPPAEQPRVGPAVLVSQKRGFKSLFKSSSRSSLSPMDAVSTYDAGTSRGSPSAGTKFSDKLDEMKASTKGVLREITNRSSENAASSPATGDTASLLFQSGFKKVGILPSERASENDKDDKKENENGKATENTKGDKVPSETSKKDVKNPEESNSTTSTDPAYYPECRPLRLWQNPQLDKESGQGPSNKEGAVSRNIKTPSSRHLHTKRKEPFGLPESSDVEIVKNKSSTAAKDVASTTAGPSHPENKTSTVTQKDVDSDNIDKASKATKGVSSDETSHIESKSSIGAPKDGDSADKKPTEPFKDVPKIPYFDPILKAPVAPRSLEIPKYLWAPADSTSKRKDPQADPVVFDFNSPPAPSNIAKNSVTIEISKPNGASIELSPNTGDNATAAPGTKPLLPNEYYISQAGKSAASKATTYTFGPWTLTTGQLTLLRRIARMLNVPMIVITTFMALEEPQMLFKALWELGVLAVAYVWLATYMGWMNRDKDRKDVVVAVLAMGVKKVVEGVRRGLEEVGEK